MSNTNKLLVAAAMMGILGAGMAATSVASAADAKGHCMGANGCKGKSACKTEASSCKGSNACKTKGFTAITKAKCDKLVKAKKATGWEAGA